MRNAAGEFLDGGRKCCRLRNFLLTAVRTDSAVSSGVEPPPSAAQRFETVHELDVGLTIVAAWLLASLADIFCQARADPRLVPRPERRG
jgi:hypothetical protein